MWREENGIEMINRDILSIEVRYSYSKNFLKKRLYPTTPTPPKI
jgi:hypothetical protein